MSDKDILKGHILSTVTWKDATIILSTAAEDFSSVVYYHEAGRWVRQDTSGDGPKMINEITATIIDDIMYVLGGNVLDRNSKVVYALDLNTLIWTKLTPGGSRFTLDNNRGCTSWAYKGDVYLLGIVVGWPESWGLFCYNISNNRWETKVTEGDNPSSRFKSSTVVKNDAVFLFGGRSLPEWHLLNDLYMLDLTTMKWKVVHGSSYETPAIPSARYGHTITPISQSTAVLLGGSVGRWPSLGEYAEDCWLLDLGKAKQEKEVTSIWTQIKLGNFYGRAFHKAVLEPVSQRLWLMGGVYTPNLLKLSLNVVPLQILAKECAANNISEDDPRLGADRFPKKLKEDIEAYRFE